MLVVGRGGWGAGAWDGSVVVCEGAGGLPRVDRLVAFDGGQAGEGVEVEGLRWGDLVDVGLHAVAEESRHGHAAGRRARLDPFVGRGRQEGYSGVVLKE